MFNNHQVVLYNNRNNNILWSDPQIRLLISERRRRNAEYYYFIPGRSRKNFWCSIANTINNTFNVIYTGQQCKNKFNRLVSDYHVRKYINKNKNIRLYCFKYVFICFSIFFIFQYFSV